MMKHPLSIAPLYCPTLLSYFIVPLRHCQSETEIRQVRAKSARGKRVFPTLRLLERLN
ncbi:MAG: hypothetical protein HC817_00720 [Saprospiraceae bacterium]|nr:hypothetical protein [Saprospiraceae bacterium]